MQFPRYLLVVTESRKGHLVPISQERDPILGTDFPSSVEQETRVGSLNQLPLRLRAIRTRKEQELIHALYRMGFAAAMAASRLSALAQTLQKHQLDAE